MSRDTGSHYRFTYRGIKLDPARIACIYNIVHPLQLVLLKKSLRLGTSPHKDTRADLRDIITAAERYLEMLDEDEENKNEE